MKKIPGKREVLEEEKKFHDKWAKKITPNDIAIIQAFEGPVSPEYHLAIKLLGDLKGKKLLNPGCGIGEEAVYLAQKGANVSALDLSGEMLKVAKRLAKGSSVIKKIKFIKNNVEKTNLPKGSFDLIFGNSILHHVDIKKTIPELSRLLKKEGKTVFIEPLLYNPIINYYRQLANMVRTPHEHPLRRKDLLEFNKHFKEVKHYEFHLFTLLIFCYFFVFEKIHPNKDRYWKKIIREGEKYKSAFCVLYQFDKIILKLFPPLKWLCWVTVIEAKK